MPLCVVEHSPMLVQHAGFVVAKLLGIRQMEVQALPLGSLPVQIPYGQFAEE